MNYGYGDGGYFFLQPLTSPRQVVSSYGDGGYFFLQPLTTPRQVVSSYGYAGAPSVYVTSSDEACKPKLAAWKAAKGNPLMKGMVASLEKELIASGCLSKSGGGSKQRPQDDPDKSAASLSLGEEESFFTRYRTPLVYGSLALAVGAAGYGLWRMFK
jgi:hypothetical protein